MQITIYIPYVTKCCYSYVETVCHGDYYNCPVYGRETFGKTKDGIILYSCMAHCLCQRVRTYMYTVQKCTTRSNVSKDRNTFWPF